MPDNVWRKNLVAHKIAKKEKKEKLKAKLEKIREVFLRNIEKSQGEGSGHTNLTGYKFENNTVIKVG